MLTPADIRRLAPAAFEFLWRTVLSREFGASYRHVDAHGLDCLTGETAYQIYHHQGAAWGVVQGKFREDLVAAQKALAKGLFRFEEYVFVTTFAFTDPAHGAWLERWRLKAQPLRVVIWGDERLCDQLARHPDLASQFGLGSSSSPQSALVGGTRSFDELLELQPLAVAILETLLVSPGDTLSLVELRRQAGLGDPTPESEFKLLMHSLTGRNLIHVTEPLPSPASATLLSAGKDYLVRHRERLALRQAKDNAD